MTFSNSYEDILRAETYSKLEFRGTYYLAYRDLPQIFLEYVKGSKALDFGCGTGRSTRFLQKLGFSTIGLDISEDMINIAREKDPEGRYLLIKDNDFSALNGNYFDLILSVFTFDNIPGKDNKVKIFQELKNLLNDDGTLISVVSSPEIYINEWVSFSTKDYPENGYAKCGDKVKIIITDTDDIRPVEDIVWPDEDYKKVYNTAGLQLLSTIKPLAKAEEPYSWVNETEIAPWVIYVLKRDV